MRVKVVIVDAVSMEKIGAETIECVGPARAYHVVVQAIDPPAISPAYSIGIDESRMPIAPEMRERLGFA